jgi:integrase
MAVSSNGRERRYRYTTPSGQGLTLVDRGTRGYQVEATIAGRGRVREAVGGGSREAAARVAIEHIESLRRSVVHPDASPALVRAGAELVVAKETTSCAASYTSAMEGHLRNFILPHYGADTIMADVRFSEHARFKHVLGEGDVDPRTCNRVLTTLRQLFKYGEEKGYCDAQPMPKNFREDPHAMAERWRILTPEQLGTLLAHATDELRPLLGYVANTGLRIGAALATEQAWIDWRRRLVRYPASAMKGRRMHTVELSDAAEEFLRLAVARCGSETTKPFPFTYWYVAHRWPAIREAAGFAELRIHDLRHSFVSNQLAAGTPIHVVRDLAAHRSLTVTALYAHASDEARRAAAQRLQIRVGAKAAPRASLERIDTGFDTGAAAQNGNCAEQLVGHLGVEPRANGLRIHCSTS